jgi:hypothetical protein
VVADDLGDDEVEELLRERRVEVGLERELLEPRDLPFLTRRVRRREVVLGLQTADALGVLEPNGQHVDERSVDVVDAGTDLVELCLGRVGHARHSMGVARCDVATITR